MNKRSLYWFRRDLRLEDNRALFQCVQESENITPIFIFDENILEKLQKNDVRVSFIMESVKKLKKELQNKGSDLFVFYGNSEEIIQKLCQEEKIEAVYTAKAHSLYGRKRDEQIKNWCFDHFIDFQDPEDTLIVPIDRIPPKKVFSAFYRCWASFPKLELLPEPQTIPTHFLQNHDSEKTFQKFHNAPLAYWNIDDWKNTVKNFNWENYSHTRDFPFLDGTSKLSVFLRFGLLSARRFLQHVQSLPFETEQLEKEIAWREFWYHIAHYFPESQNTEFQEKRRYIKWNDDEKIFQAWCEGKTGYPIVDAGMRQLNQTGFMHGRLRMIVASFLTKDLLIDWRWGEKYFAEKLMDYDEAVNIGNWQWSASVGADPRPLRIFSPMLQAERFDPEAIFIKKYLPELSHFSAKELHHPLDYPLPYIKPIVDHRVQQKKAKEMYFLSRSAYL